MKYIIKIKNFNLCEKHNKTYEGKMWKSDDPEYHMKKDEFKFKIGDYVRIINTILHSVHIKKYIFYINGVADDMMDDEDKQITYFLKYAFPDYIDSGVSVGHLDNYGWVTEDELELVPDYEIDAMKYNL